MERILIIGLNGSGKSTFANQLGKRLNREVAHLDKIYYQSRWKHVQTPDEWREEVRNLVSKDKWIIEGQYTGTLDIRMPAADTIIYFDINKFVCLYRAFKRVLDKTQPFDKPEGNLNHMSWNLIKKIIIFPKKKMLERLEQYKDTKKIFVVKNSGEARELLKRLTGN